MKTLKKEDVIKQLTDSGALVNSYLQLLMKKQQGLYGFKINNEKGLFNTLFHYHKHSQILTPKTQFGFGREYSLEAVAQHMIDKEYTFEKLAKETYPGTYKGSWFARCQHIYENFSYKKFGSLILKMPSSNEIKHNPNTTFRIADGSHRCLVLAYKLIKKEIEFKPLEAILLIAPQKL